MPAAGLKPVAPLPPPALRAYSRGVQILCSAAQALAALGVLISFVLIGAAVVLRYVFSAAPLWVDEVVGFTLVGVVMLGAAASLRHGEHIAVDLILTRLQPPARRWLVLWSASATLLVAALLVFNGWQAKTLAQTIGTLTEGHLEWPVARLMWFIVVGGFLLGLAAIEVAWRAWAGVPMVAAPADDGAHGLGEGGQ